MCVIDISNWMDCGGGAALSVFCGHIIGLMTESELINDIQSSPFRIFWDGAGAVDLFFVLSGFVLALPYLHDAKNPNYFKFCIQRAFRIYPAYWLALLVSISLRQNYSPSGMLELSKWANSLWSDPLTLWVFLKHLTLLNGVNTRAIDPVVLTLIIEMRMSLLMPFVIVGLNLSSRIFIDILLFVISLVIGFSLGTLSMLPLFAMGAIAAKHISSLQIKAEWQSGCVGALLVGMLLCGNRQVFHGFTSYQQDLVSGVGALMIIFSSIFLLL